MVRKSFGKMRGTRRKLKSTGKPTVNKYMEEFEKDENVYISIYSGDKFPHPDFHGKVGKITEKRGSSYSVRIKEGNSFKTVFLRPVHIRKMVKDDSNGN